MEQKYDFDTALWGGWAMGDNSHRPSSASQTAFAPVLHGLAQHGDGGLEVAVDRAPRTPAKGSYLCGRKVVVKAKADRISQRLQEAPQLLVPSERGLRFQSVSHLRLNSLVARF